MVPVALHSKMQSQVSVAKLKKGAEASGMFSRQESSRLLQSMPTKGQSIGGIYACYCAQRNAKG